MSIVRSLLVRVGFLQDKPSQQGILRSISRVRLAFVGLQSIALFAAAKVGSYFNQISQSLIKNDELARTLGTTLSRVTALQNALADFRIDDSEFRRIFLRLNQLIRDYRTGASEELALIARSLGINLEEVGDDSEELFKLILKGLGSITNETDRIAIADKIFQGNVGARISIVSQNIDKLSESTENYLEIGKQAEKILPSVDEYTKSVNALSRAWESFAQATAINILPLLSDVLTALKFITNYLVIWYDLMKGGLSALTGDTSLLRSAASRGSALLDAPFQSVGDYFSGIGSNISSGLNNLGFGGVSMVPSNITLNNEIQIGAGSSEEQAQDLLSQINRSVVESIDNTFRMIQYNNPTAE